MEDRPPPDDDPFEWEEAPPRRRRSREREPSDTGERDSLDRERDPFDIREEPEEQEPPRPGDPYEPGTGSYRREPSTGERDAIDTGERDPYDTGERDPFDTGGRASGTGEWTIEREPPQPGDSYQPSERAYETVEQRASQEEPEPLETGEWLETGERPEAGERVETGERARRRRETRERRARREREPTTGEQRRHRDLPASVRRRQAIGIGVVALVVLVGGIVLASGGDGGDEEEPLPLKKLAGQTIITPMSEEGPDEKLLRSARRGRIGGIFVRAGEGELRPEDVQADVARVSQAAQEGGNPPLLVMTDQEGGFVKELPGPPDVGPNELGEAGDPAAAEVEGQKTAQFLAPLGVNVDLAPLLDVTITQTDRTIRTRTFGDDPAVVSEIGVAFIQGLQENGVAATAKHFPGLGLSTVNTDFERADIAASPEDQEAALIPFQDAVDAGVDLVMMSSAVYPELDAENPAVLSPAVVQGQLRDELGFEGLIITDDLQARGISDVMAVNEAALAALIAGNDLLLFARARTAAAQGLAGIVRAEKQGNIDRAVIQAAYDRITTYKATLPGAD
jgi:beta-N-acetylhexosaminidase